MHHLIALILSVLFLSSPAQAASTATSDQATVELVAGGYDESGQLQLGLHYTLKPGWHIYWRTPGDTGYPPQLDWSASKNVQSTNLRWPAPTRLQEELIPGQVSESYLYKDEVLFPIALTPQNPAEPVSIILNVNYAICAELCIPAEAALTLDIPPGYQNEAALATIQKHPLPKANGEDGVTISDVQFLEPNRLQISINSPSQNLEKSDIFIEAGKNFSFTNPTATYESNRAIFTLQITPLADEKLEHQTLTITWSNGESAVEYSIPASDIPTAAAPLPAPAVTYSLLLILAFALLGGLILNVMPCVLPVLSIKLIGVIKHGGGSKAKVATSFALTALGIIASFIALAFLVISLRAAGHNVGWGFHFQEPLFIIALIILLTLFAANMWGLFEFHLPAIGGKAFDKSAEDSPLGHFLTGVFATVLATPCTAPFLGTAIGFAIGHGPFEILLTFAAMGLGMALPYLLFCLFPGAITLLPKPGAWMITLKKIMGVFLAVAAVWLLWVLSDQLGNLAAIALLLLSIAKILKFHLTAHWSAKLRHGVLALLIGLSFLLPITLSSPPPQPSAVAIDLWQPFAPDTIPALVASGKTVFVDITADWCLTCKVNKFRVLSSAEVLEALRQPNVVAMQADWTNKDSQITDYLLTHHRIGIPFNIIFSPRHPEGQVLSELLGKDEVLDGLR